MRITIENNNGRMRFCLIGELDDKVSDEARVTMDEALSMERYRDVTLDMSKLKFMDSTGIGVIIGRYKRLKKYSIPMYISNPNRQVDKILNLCGIYQIIKKIS